MRRTFCGSAVLLTAVLVLPHRVPAQDPASTTPAAPSLLEMPFVPQSEALCGGAALAMVLRHHGIRGVEAEDFAHLVVETGEGIRTTDLTDAARERGLEATPFTGQRDVVRALLAAGDPVIALIEDRPGIYHYVVLLAWGDGRVLFHDPAVGPHQVMSEAQLMRAWQPAGYWALRARGAAGAASAHTDAVITNAARRVDVAADGLPTALHRSAGDAESDDICDAHLQTAATAAAAGEFPAAEQALDEAQRVCADTTIVTRERAGLRFRQNRYDEAESAAVLRLAHAPGDTHAWELLAASRFMQGERSGALAAWNRIGRPYNDLTRIDGLRRTPHAVVNEAVDIAPGERVTTTALARARRRAAALPSIARARVDYHPVSRDTVQVDVAVLEHPVVSWGAFDLALHAVRAVAEQRLLVQPAGVVRIGERWRIDATWQEHRRALAFGVSIPRVFGLRAITHLDAGVRDWTFGHPSSPFGAGSIRETVRGASIVLSDWSAASIEWRAGLGIDEWQDQSLGSVLAGGTLHVDNERVVLGAELAGWWGPDADAIGRARVRVALHTSLAAHTEGMLLLHGAITGEAGPRALWNGAGAGRVGGALLRAHPLLDSDGVIRSQWWAPRLGAATIEVRHWFTTLGPVDAGGAVFLDGALAAGAMAGPSVPAADTGMRGAADGGIGLRLRLSGGTVIRLDAAHGIGSRASALSLSLGRAMP